MAVSIGGKTRIFDIVEITREIRCRVGVMAKEYYH